MAYFLNNYLIYFSSAFVAALTFGWALSEKYSSRRIGAKGTSNFRRAVIHFLISLIIALPIGVVAGNYASIGTRNDAISNLTRFRQDLVEKIKWTEDSWAESGFLSKRPVIVPWPLLVEEHEFSKWNLDFQNLYHQVTQRFSQRASHYCGNAKTIIDRPHVATFRVEPVGKESCRFVVAHSLSYDELNYLINSLEECEVAMKLEADIFYIPLLNL